MDENGDGSIGSFQKNIYALWKFLHYVRTSLHKMARSELLLSSCLSAWNSTTNLSLFNNFYGYCIWNLYFQKYCFLFLACVLKRCPCYILANCVLGLVMSPEDGSSLPPKRTVSFDIFMFTL